MSNSEFVNQLSSLKPNSTFLTLNGYTNAKGEKANYSLVFNMSYENAVRKSQEIVASYTPLDADETKAQKSILESFEKTLEKGSDEIEDDDTYTRFYDEDGKKIKGVKLHTKNNSLHLYGLLVHKRILTPAEYKPVKSSSYTIAREKIMRLTAISKFRQFKILASQVDSISVQGLNLLPDV